MHKSIFVNFLVKNSTAIAPVFIRSSIGRLFLISRLKRTLKEYRF